MAKVNLTGVKYKGVGNFKVATEGNYLVKIIKAEKKISQKGTEGVNFRFQIQEDMLGGREFTGLNVFATEWLNLDKEGNPGYGMKRIGTIIDAIGGCGEEGFDTDDKNFYNDFINEIIEVNVKQAPKWNDPNTMINEIGYYVDKSESNVDQAVIDDIDGDMPF